MAITGSGESTSLHRHASTRGPQVWRALIGLGLAASGLAAMAWLFAAVYGLGPAFDAAAFRLGLGGATLISALCQIAILLGLWLTWRALNPSRRH